MRAASVALAACFLLLSLCGCLATNGSSGTRDTVSGTPDQRRQQAESLLSKSNLLQMLPALLPNTPSQSMQEHSAQDADRAAALFASLGDDKGVHRAMLNKGNALQWLHRLPEANTAYTAASQAGERGNCAECVALAERGLGVTAGLLDDRAAALSHLRRSTVMYEGAGAGRQAAISWSHIAGFSLLWSDFDTAADAYRRSEQLFATQRDGELLASQAMMGLAEVARRRGDFDGAVSEARRALDLRRMAKLRRYEVDSWIFLADVEAQRQRPDAAGGYLTGADAAARAGATATLRAMSLLKVGQAYRRHQRFQKARRTLEETLAIYSQEESTVGMAVTETVLGEHALADNDLSAAHRRVSSARDRLSQDKGLAPAAPVLGFRVAGFAPMERWEAESNLELLDGELKTSNQRWSEAMPHFDAALAQFRRHDRPRDIARSQMLRGLALLGMQRFDDARDALMEAAGLYRDSGDAVKTVEVDGLLRGLDLAVQKAG